MNAARRKLEVPMPASMPCKIPIRSSGETHRNLETVVSGKHSIFTRFPKDRNCNICLRTKITRASCRRRTPRADNFGDLITADHKVLSLVKKVNLETIIVTLLWYQTWQHSGYNHTHVKQKFLRKHRRAWKSSLSQRGKPKVIYTDNSLELFQILWRSVLESLCLEWKKGRLRCCCNHAWTMIGWRIPWNVIPIFETFKISILMGRHLMTGGSEYHSMARLSRLEQW